MIVELARRVSSCGWVALCEQRRAGFARLSGRRQLGNARAGSYNRTFKPQNSRDFRDGCGRFILIFLPGWSLPRFGGAFLSGQAEPNPGVPNCPAAEDGNPSARGMTLKAPLSQRGGAFSTPNTAFAMIRRSISLRWEDCTLATRLLLLRGNTLAPSVCRQGTSPRGPNCRIVPLRKTQRPSFRKLTTRTLGPASAGLFFRKAAAAASAGLFLDDGA